MHLTWKKSSSFEMLEVQNWRGERYYQFLFDGEDLNTSSTHKRRPLPNHSTSGITSFRPHYTSSWKGENCSQNNTHIPFKVVVNCNSQFVVNSISENFFYHGWFFYNKNTPKWEKKLVKIYCSSFSKKLWTISFYIHLLVGKRTTTFPGESNIILSLYLGLIFLPQ